MKTIAIIGAGAAGMMACATICESDLHGNIFLIDKNSDIGQKVLLTGGGRCNLTTGLTDIKEILKRYPRGAKFLKYAMYEFSPEKARKWFLDHKLRTKVEDDMRVFPASDKSMDVISVFMKIFDKHKVKMLMSNEVLSVKKVRDGFELDLQDRKLLTVNKMILAAGGGSYEIAQSFGHTITKLVPSLSALKLADPMDLAGVTVKKAGLRLRYGTDKYEYEGPFVFTHSGISGPAIFALSALAAYADFDDKNPAKLFIDFAPDLSREDVLQDIKNEISSSPKKDFANTLAKFVPKSATSKFKGKNAAVGKNEINKSVEFIKNCEFAVIGRAGGNEFVTAGGISLDEVDPKTMESKICHGLYFGGEVLDIDGVTGGFNLQAAWATGRIAGVSAVN
ncbi:MAG: hypothetical protein UV80_C0002G0079 [Candidatus Peregrinibacteria bacterium GW2011_GWF2_43_17]|nr:MAG: hypothetical protein UV80_C0002G0079 [Candidatus Peregrinibacteria bacterium GW2011_GWF2_43_17]